MHFLQTDTDCFSDFNIYKERDCKIDDHMNRYTQSYGENN